MAGVRVFTGNARIGGPPFVQPVKAPPTVPIYGRPAAVGAQQHRADTGRPLEVNLRR